MASGGALTTSEYIVHHLTNLTVGHGFWTFHLDTLIVSGLLGLVAFVGMARLAGRATSGVPGKMQAAVEIGIPIINCGPGGKTGDEASLVQTIDEIGNLVQMAEKYGVTLCVKAHVGAAIYNTPTTLRIMDAISSPAFGIDMDPSHIYRANENPVEAIAAVIARVKHVHIRDCKGRQQGPGKPELQANGRGDIDLVGYIRVLHENGYQGPLNLEIIGAKEYSVEQCCVIAAESRGHMQACLQACGAR